jgi:hypothetical protein
VQIRLHKAALYNSIYRADDDLLVNQHVYGTPAAHAPVFALRSISESSMATAYVDSFNRIWETATTLAKLDWVRFHAGQFMGRWDGFAAAGIYTVTRDQEGPWTVKLILSPIATEAFGLTRFPVNGLGVSPAPTCSSASAG